MSADKVYSRNKEDYPYDGIDEALEAIDNESDLEPGLTIYQGDKVQHVASEFFCIDSLCEDMQERAYDEGGECADDFPDLSKAQTAELETLVKTWLDANVKVRFWTVENAVAITVTEQMIDDYRGQP